MSSYGGFQRTNYSAQGGDDAGGFVGGSQQQGSQGGGGGRSYGDESLRPVTIKQLADWTEAFPGQDTIIDGSPLTQLTLVGQIRKINPQATNVTYTLDDGTATIDVKKWVDAERSGEDGGDESTRFQPDQYVRIWGRLKSFNGKKHVGAHFIRAIEDYDEVNYHLVEAAYVHLYLTKGTTTQQGGSGGGTQQGQRTGGNDGGDSMFVDGGGAGGGYNASGKLANLSRAAQMVHQFLANSPGGSEGVNVYDIAAGTGISAEQARREAEALMDAGVLYTTVDDDTWALLEL